MSDETEDNVTELPKKQDNKKATSKSILSQVQAEVDKGRAEATKGKFKELLKKRVDAEKILAGINREILELSEAFDNGEL